MFPLLFVFAFFQAVPADAPPAGFDLPLVAALTAFIALPVKFLVDVVRGTFTSISNLIPIIGIVIGFLFSVVVLVAIARPLTASVLAQCLIAGVGAQIAAMAASGGQNKANESRAAATNP